MAADEERNAQVNVAGTQNAVDLANSLDVGMFHHTSSIAVAGLFSDGTFTEDMFDEGQKLAHPYHRTKFESERVVRERVKAPLRIYRPSIVVGNSKTGEMDKIDGPYYFFKVLQKIRHALPEWFPLISVEWGWTNIVPVDYVAAAMDHIAHKGELENNVFHIVDPKGQRVGEVLNTFAEAGHAPRAVMRIDRRALQNLPKGVIGFALKLPALKQIRRNVLADLGIPDEVVEYIALTCRFDARDAQRALRDSTITIPTLPTYADKLWDYWERELDPDLYKDHSFEGAVNGKTVIITGASSGIGRAAALKIAAAGGIPILVARTREKLEEVKTEIEAAGGTAYVAPCDLSDFDAIEELVEKLLADHPRIDMLVNNAGRSIRRSVAALLRPLPRLRAHGPPELPEPGEADARAAPAHARPGRRAHRQRVEHRRADQPAAVQRVRRVQVRARRVHARGEQRDDRRQRDLHDHPHAARAHADDRADEDVRLVPDDLARGSRGPRVRGDPRQAEADQHEARHVRGGRLRARAEGRRPDPAPRVPRVPGVHGGQGRQGRRRRRGQGVRRGDRARVSDEGRALVTLSSGGLEATFEPAAGMHCVSLRHDGDQLLADVTEHVPNTPWASGIPLLHPWANRLGGFEYTFDGVAVALDRADLYLEEHGLPLHGLRAAVTGWEPTFANEKRIVAGRDVTEAAPSRSRTGSPSPRS